MAGRTTPVMRQFHEAKSAYPDCVLFFRMGDFYEMFEDDAVLCAEKLDLTLTARNKGKGDEIPMAGVPHHAAHGYISRLLEQGYKVAVCEQMADPSTVKGIVPREVVRVLTPSLVTDREHLDAATNNWLAAIDADEAGGCGAALLDLSTGQLVAGEVLSTAHALAEVARERPREALMSADLASELTAAMTAVGAAVRVDEPLTEDACTEALGQLATDARNIGIGAARAAARALRYARRCNPRAELPVRRVAALQPAAHMVIDETTCGHLELVQSNTGDKKATLLAVVDMTKTPPGARLLRRRLLAPLLDVERIRRRLDQVELFVVHSRLREELRDQLKQVGDLERLSVRASMKEANPRDLGAIRTGLQHAQAAAQLLLELDDVTSRDVLGLTKGVDLVDDLRNLLASALVERPPAQPKDGAIFRADFDEELARLSGVKHDGTSRLTELERDLREKHDLPTLKIRYTRVFGWYAEVSKTHTSKVPNDWRRKQTVASGERYTLAELDELADEIAHAEELHRARELELLAEVTTAARDAAERVRALASRLARWDISAALAEVAHRYDYARPTIDSGAVLSLTESRHPVVERLVAQGRFVPNDVALDADAARLWLVTGPNMAGKSTALRQVALTCILAQAGSYVPAATAHVGAVDRVLSRVGASDNLAGGESTFMVEMRETAQILRAAGPRSLVILDEIGRGTSTFDGLAIAWAVAEHLDQAIGCRAMFATHYHELTALAEASEHVLNYSVSARELRGDVVFLHRLSPGAVSRSYGVLVAKLAGLPEAVLARARAVLDSLEQTGSPRPESGVDGAGQLDLFVPPHDRSEAEVLSTIRALDADNLTPLEALGLLARLKKQLAD